MEKCKFCDAQLEEEVTLCPNCGKDNAEMEAAAEETAEAEVTVQETAEAEAAVQEPVEETAEVAVEETTEIKEGIKATPGKIALAVVAIVVLIALIAGLLAGGMGKAKDSAAVQETEA